MATATITITSASNPTYGGRIDFDGGSTYDRFVLSAADPSALSDTVSDFRRVFAFFDLSTDPTSGGTITMVELLATVASVGGTPAVHISGVLSSPDTWENYIGDDPPTTTIDEGIYQQCRVGDYSPFLTAQTYSAGAIAVDLGADAIAMANACVNAGTFFVGIGLSNEAAAGSVVFDATAGFGLRITYTTSGPTAAQKTSSKSATWIASGVI